MMRVTRHPHISWKCRLLALCLLLFPFLAHGQNADLATVIRGIDASVQNRVVHVASYVAIEHYSVYRGSNKTAPDAEMTVRTEYRRSQGKNFTILSQNGSSLLRNKLLGTLLDNEKKMSQPGTRENVLINSANYAMTLQAGTPQMLNGHPCLVLNLHPRRNDSSLFEGTLWVDAKDYSIVQLSGRASKSPSILAGAPNVVRQYSLINGVPMAIHATAITPSSLFGETTVRIDSGNYQIQITPGS